MKKVLGATTVLLASTAIASAGGVQRSDQSVAILFEDGRYGELSFGMVSPDVSGTENGLSTGDIAPAFLLYALRLHQDVTEQLSFSLVVDSHIGADVGYPAGAPVSLEGTTASLDGASITAYARYELPSNFSVYGGVRVSRISGDVGIPVFAYTLEADPDTAFGYVVGAAYERPEMALRVSLTYNSAIEHTLDSTEVLGATTVSTFDTTIPQSLHLEAQTGVAPGTLVFGSVRWVDWTEFDVSPIAYTTTIGSPLVSYEDDTITYMLGVGRQFTEEFAGSVSFEYEPQTGGTAANLAPTDGRFGISLGGSYTTPTGVEISGGVNYTWIGDATTVTPLLVPGIFTDNYSVGAGVTIGMNF